MIVNKVLCTIKLKRYKADQHILEYVHTHTRLTHNSIENKQNNYLTNRHELLNLVQLVIQICNWN